MRFARYSVLVVLALLLTGCAASSTATGASGSPSASSPSPVVESASPSPSPTPTATVAVALCTNATNEVSLASQEGGAGTIRSVWKAKNVSNAPCSSYAYPGMDFHVTGGWLDLHVHRGGFQDINETPQRIVLQPGGSLYFVSYWSEADTAAGPCKQFDRLKVTLPNNFVSAEITQAGCVSASQPVDVGPVTATAPA